ncbi:MAG: hypothetical protein BWY99_02169 [Synergistetes bacterium ADurb.BinA166]|nr:MAG: hypothetical protein BWY99_02169 [Synergistetes bacterium ADurb.BinA166]
MNRGISPSSLNRRSSARFSRASETTSSFFAAGSSFIFISAFLTVCALRRSESLCFFMRRSPSIRRKGSPSSRDDANLSMCPLTSSEISLPNSAKKRSRSSVLFLSTKPRNE